MLCFYGDESFKNQPGFQGCYTLAGFLTDSAIWVAIDRAWEEAKNTPPSIRWFKMHDYWERVGEFEGFTKQQADRKYRHFLKIVEVLGRKLAWIDSIITYDCFHAVVDQRPIAKSVFKDPYIFCLVGVFRLATGALEATVGSSEDLPTVTFVFDEQKGLDHHVLEMHRFLKQNGTHWPIVEQILFEDDRVSNPLQCADLLAWHVRRNYVRPVEDKRKPLPSYTLLQNSVFKRWSGVWKEQGLKDWLDQFEGHLEDIPLP